RANLGLDRPVATRFLAYLLDVLRLDLGRSIFRNESVTTAIASRIGATVEVAVLAVLFAAALGIALGVVAAMRRGSAIDAGCMLFAQLGVSMPVFWLGILLMYLLAVRLGWLPAIGRGEPLGEALFAALTGRPDVLVTSLSHLVLPALTLGLHAAALLSRLVRSSLLETLNADYVRTARAKGLAWRRVVLSHALRNAMLPVISVIGLQFGALLSGAVLTEGIFGWPGLGQLAVAAISQRDLPLVQGLVLTFALMFALVNLAVDLLSAVIDPRVRLK
ncbi:MAG: ABC transporter permease, partial [Alphaproteobacteria bacterium]|nr:ABC transporter permease [Alphaproteobacteria bacterium]